MRLRSAAKKSVRGTEPSIMAEIGVADNQMNKKKIPFLFIIPEGHVITSNFGLLCSGSYEDIKRSLKFPLGVATPVRRENVNEDMAKSENFFFLSSKKCMFKNAEVNGWHKLFQIYTSFHEVESVSYPYKTGSLNLKDTRGGTVSSKRIVLCRNSHPPRLERLCRKRAFDYHLTICCEVEGLGPQSPYKTTEDTQPMEHLIIVEKLEQIFLLHTPITNGPYKITSNNCNNKEKTKNNNKEKISVIPTPSTSQCTTSSLIPEPTPESECQPINKKTVPKYKSTRSRKGKAKRKRVIADKENLQITKKTCLHRTTEKVEILEEVCENKLTSKEATQHQGNDVNLKGHSQKNSGYFIKDVIDPPAVNEQVFQIEGQETINSLLSDKENKDESTASRSDQSHVLEKNLSNQIDHLITNLQQNPQQNVEELTSAADLYSIYPVPSNCILELGKILEEGAEVGFTTDPPKITIALKDTAHLQSVVNTISNTKDEENANFQFNRGSLNQTAENIYYQQPGAGVSNMNLYYQQPGAGLSNTNQTIMSYNHTDEALDNKGEAANAKEKKILNKDLTITSLKKGDFSCPGSFTATNGNEPLQNSGTTETNTAKMVTYKDEVFDTPEAASEPSAYLYNNHYNVNYEMVDMKKLNVLHQDFPSTSDNVTENNYNTQNSLENIFLPSMEYSFEDIISQWFSANINLEDIDLSDFGINIDDYNNF